LHKYPLSPSEKLVLSEKWFRVLAVVYVFLILFLGSSVQGVAAVSPSALTKLNSEFAGYFLEYSKSPGNMEIQGTWVIPTASSCSAFADIDYTIGVGGEGAGTDILCPSSGATPEYSPYCAISNLVTCTSLPSGDTMSPGDKVEATVSITYSTKAASITIKDVSRGWTYTMSGKDTTSLTPVYARWDLAGGPDTTGMVFTTVKTTGDSATFGGHTGKIGSFLSVSGVTVYEYTYVDALNGHILAQPASITSKSNSFNIKFVAVS